MVDSIDSPYQLVSRISEPSTVSLDVLVFFLGGAGVSGESFLEGYSVWFHVVSIVAVDLVHGMGLTYFDRCTPLMRGIPAVVLLHCCCANSHVLPSWPCNQSNQSNSVSGLAAVSGFPFHGCLRFLDSFAFLDQPLHQVQIPFTGQTSINRLAATNEQTTKRP